jgi:hypothetical protein
MSECQARDGPVVVNADNLMMRIEFEINDGGALAVGWVARLQISRIDPDIMALLGRRQTDWVFWGQCKRVVSHRLRRSVIPDHTANKCHTTIATCNLIAFKHIPEWFGATIRHLDARIWMKAHRCDVGLFSLPTDF